jgi:murein DD-endopeptidase MepM/ murein hydrolase activator NlpD
MRASLLALLVLLVSGTEVRTANADPDPADAPRVVAPETSAPDAEAAADDDDAPPHFHWSDGPRSVSPPRGVSRERAEALGLGTRACAMSVLHGSIDPRWIEAARGRSPSRLLWPVDDGRFGRGYGYVRTTRPDLIHRGVDVGAEEGEVVRAAADGIVVYSDNGVHGYGNVVIILHRNGWATLYAHNSRTTVQAGYRVRRGERIALVGHTGIAHGPHVHFELWDHGHAVDPVALFDGGPTHVQRLAERAAARGDVPPVQEVTAADRPAEGPLPPASDRVAVDGRHRARR